LSKAVPTPSPSGVIAYSHLEIDATGPGRKLAILFGDSERRARWPLALRDFDGNRIFVRPASKAWYHDGVPGLGKSLEEMAASLRRIVDALQPSHVVTVGAAMGGYAAVAFGCLLQADRIVALSAELQLMLPGSRSGKDLPSPPRKFGDLLPHLQDRKPASVWLVASEAEIVELHGAVRAAALPSVQAVALRNTPHLTIRSLDSNEGCALLAAAGTAGASQPAIDAAGDLLNDRAAIDAAFEAHTLLLEKRGAEAERHAAHAVERRPDWPLAQHLLGRTLALQGRDSDAVAAATRAAALDPTQALFRHHHGVVLARLGRFAEAAEAQRAAIDGGHQSPWAYHHLGVALQRSGDIAGAEAALRAASEKRPKTPLFHHHLAVVLTALGRIAEAELSARTAVALDEENGDYLRQLARILRAQGRTGDADAMFKQAESVDPTGASPAEIAAEETPATEQAEPPVDLPASVAEILSRVPRA
jgi:Flp pilus assembly protein TadD